MTYTSQRFRVVVTWRHPSGAASFVDASEWYDNQGEAVEMIEAVTYKNTEFGAPHKVQLEIKTTHTSIDRVALANGAPA